MATIRSLSGRKPGLNAKQLDKIWQLHKVELLGTSIIAQRFGVRTNTIREVIRRMERVKEVQAANVVTD